jgi:hypothetical protein
MARIVYKRRPGVSLPSPNVGGGGGGGDFAPLSNGRLWVNINGPYDFLSEHMPLNIMKNARPWFSDLAGGLPTPRAAGTALVATVMDADGYPTEIPAPLTYVETVMLSQQRPENGSELNGRYRFTFDGAGTYTINGSGVSNITYSAGQAEFDLTLPATPGESTLTVVITALTPGNHMRNMKMFKTEHAALVAAGRLTRPNYPFNNVGCLRWMETQAINNDPYPRGAGQWPTPNTFSWGHRGISIEEICQAANETGVRPWINIHHAATDAYVTHIATVARNNLNPALPLYVEFTNEIWNFSFPGQTSYAIAQANALWGVRPEPEGSWLQWHGGRGAQVMDIFSSVFAGQTSRLVRVLGVATGVPGWEALQLDAPLWVGLGRPAPRLSYDAIAVGGYWGSELQQDPAIPAALLTQLNISQAAAEAYLRNRYLSPSTEGSAQGELFGEWDYFRGVCNTRGLDMLMYEGGTHLVLESSYSNHPQLQPFINAYNYSADIVEFYRRALNRWAIVGDSGYNQFVTYGYPGSAGPWGMLRYWGDDTGRSDILLSYNVSGAGPPIGGKTRDVYAFLNSLHNHDAGAGNENTSTGNWVRRFAVAAPNGGHTYTLGWQFGFAAPGGWTTLPRSSQQEVAPNVYINDPGNPAWTGATNIEIVELVPDNFFGPLVAPDQPNVEGWVYTTRFLHHIDNWEANAPNANRVYAVHGGWPLLSGSYGTFASQTPAQRAAYIAHALGTYQTWLNDLTSLLQAARPTLRIVQYGINRASMLAWRDTVMNTIPTVDLFEDNAPHGRSTMYFVNAIANYIEIFDEKPPANFSINPAWGVHTTVVNNYQAIVDYIWSALRE